MFAVPLIAWVNCCFCDASKLTVLGVNEIVISGVSVIVAVAVLVTSAALIAVTVITC